MNLLCYYFIRSLYVSLKDIYFVGLCSLIKINYYNYYVLSKNINIKAPPFKETKHASVFTGIVVTKPNFIDCSQPRRIVEMYTPSNGIFSPTYDSVNRVKYSINNFREYKYNYRNILENLMTYKKYIPAG